MVDPVSPPPCQCVTNGTSTPERLAVPQPRWTDGAAFRGADGVDVDDARALPPFLRPLARELLAAGRAAALLVQLEQVRLAKGQCDPTIVLSLTRGRPPQKRTRILLCPAQRSGADPLAPWSFADRWHAAVASATLAEPTHSDTTEPAPPASPGPAPASPPAAPASPPAAPAPDAPTDAGRRSLPLGRRVLWPQDGDDGLRPILPLSPRLVDGDAPSAADAASAEATDRQSWAACRRLIDGRTVLPHACGLGDPLLTRLRHANGSSAA